MAKNCGRLEGETEVVGREVHELRGQRSKSLRPSSLAVMVKREIRYSKCEEIHIMYQSRK